MRHTISLPDPMSEYIDKQVNTGMYGNISEYIRDLIRKDQEQRQTAITELRTLLDKAEASGFSTLSMDDIRAKARARVGL